MNLQMDTKYDTSKILNFGEVPIWRRTMLRALIPFSLVQIAYKQFKQVIDKNCMHDGTRAKLSGVKFVAMAEEPISFASIKESSRTFGITINDLLTCALSNTMAEFFEKRGDKSKMINIVIPANIRWSMYKKSEDVKLENKFAPIALRIPIIPGTAESLKGIKEVTRELREGFHLTYCLYVISLASAMFLPAYLCRKLGDEASLPFTLAFSNTPGVLKPVGFGDI